MNLVLVSESLSDCSSLYGRDRCSPYPWGVRWHGGVEIPIVFNFQPPVVAFVNCTDGIPELNEDCNDVIDVPVEAGVMQLYLPPILGVTASPSAFGYQNIRVCAHITTTPQPNATTSTTVEAPASLYASRVPTSVTVTQPSDSSITLCGALEDVNLALITNVQMQVPIIGNTHLVTISVSAQHATCVADSSIAVGFQFKTVVNTLPTGKFFALPHDQHLPVSPRLSV